MHHKGQQCLKEVSSEYPYYIKGLWISDYIGNISSSNALRTASKVSLEFRPRFPVCGGWQTDWNQGYNMPVKHHLSKSTTDTEFFRLVVPFYHSYDTLLTEEYRVEVTLPHGAQNIKVSYLRLRQFRFICHSMLMKLTTAVKITAPSSFGHQKRYQSS